MLQGRILSTYWVVLAWSVVTLVMLRGLLGRARLRRRAWRSAYLYPESVWNRRLRGGVVMMGVQCLKGAGLAIVLLLTLIRLGAEPDFWRLLLVAVLLTLVLRMIAERFFWHDAAPAYRPELVARVSLWGAGGVMLVLLLLWALIQPQPDFREATLEQALWHAMDQEVAASGLLENGLQGLAAWQGVEQWVAQMLTSMNQSPWFHIGVWASLLVRKSLFVMALLVLFNGVLAGRLHDGGR